MNPYKPRSKRLNNIYSKCAIFVIDIIIVIIIAIITATQGAGIV
jgi:hypothetical protein